MPPPVPKFSLGARNLAILLPAFVLASCLNIVLGLHMRVLTGLRVYYASGARPAGVGISQTKKVRTRHAKKADDADLGGENLVIFKLTPAILVGTQYIGTLDLLVVIMFTAALSFAAAEGAIHWMGWGLSGMSVVAALGCTAHALGSLALTGVLSTYTSGEDKAYAFIFGFLGFCTALATQLLPSSLLALDVKAAAHAVGPLLVAFARSRDAALEGLHLELPTAALQLALASLAGCIAALLFAPCLRFARGYWLTRSPPEWGADYIGCGIIGRVLLNLQLVLALGVAILWVRPLGADFWGLTPEQLGAAQAVALLAMAAVQLFNARTLLQRYLDGALVSWHQLKHGARTKKPDRGTIAALIDANCKAVLVLTGKAAVQCVAPAALFLGLGLLQLFSVLHPRMLADSGSANALLDAVAGFLGFWSGSTCFALCSACIFLFRTGTLK